MKAILLMALAIHVAAFDAEAHNRSVRKNSFEGAIDAAFIRVETILRSPSDGARFFGPDALEALAALKTTIQLSAGAGPYGCTAIQQVYGEEASVVGRIDSDGGFQRRYRIPSRMIFYMNGPFFAGSKYTITTYQSGTNPAQTIALLHELAHNIANANGGYLIPDDGPQVPNAQCKSSCNSMMIYRLCRNQIWKGR